MPKLTASEAINLLKSNPTKYATPKALKSLVNKVSIDSSGKVTVLYGGMVNESISTNDLIEKMLANGEDIRVIDKTEAAKLLKSDKYIEAVAKAFNTTVDAVKNDKTNAGNQFLYDATKGQWANILGEFSAESTGDVQIIGDIRIMSGLAEIDQTLKLIVVPEIMSNRFVTKINGAPKDIFRIMLYKTNSMDEIFEQIIGSSYNLTMNIEMKTSIALNSNGQPLLNADGTHKTILENVDATNFFKMIADEEVILPKEQTNISIKTFIQAGKRMDGITMYISCCFFLFIALYSFLAHKFKLPLFLSSPLKGIALIVFIPVIIFLYFYLISNSDPRINYKLLNTIIIAGLSLFFIYKIIY